MFLTNSQNSQENWLKPATLVNKSLRHRWFTVNLVKFLRTPFYKAPPVATSTESFDSLCCEENNQNYMCRIIFLLTLPNLIWISCNHDNIS